MVDRTAIGQSLEPVTARVEAGRLRYFFKTIGESNPIYSDRQASATQDYAANPVPPTYLFCLEMMDKDRPFDFLTDLNIDLARVLHGEQSFKYHAPVLVDDTLTFKSRVTDVFDKKNGSMTFVVITTEVTNQNGVHVADTARTIVVRNQVG